MVKRVTDQEDQPKVLKKVIGCGRDSRAQRMVVASLNLLNSKKEDKCRKNYLCNENFNSPRKKSVGIDSQSFYSVKQRQGMSTPPKTFNSNTSPRSFLYVQRSRKKYQPVKEFTHNDAVFDKLLEEDKTRLSESGQNMTKSKNHSEWFDSNSPYKAQIISLHDTPEKQQSKYIEKNKHSKRLFEDVDQPSSKKKRNLSEPEEFSVIPETATPPMSPEIFRRKSSESPLGTLTDPLVSHSFPLHKDTSRSSPLGLFRESPRSCSLTPFRKTSQISQFRSTTPIPNRPLDWTMGFPNNGNTCYLSSVVQCVLRITKIQEIIQKMIEFQVLLEKPLAETSIIKILAAILKGEGVLSSNLKRIMDVCCTAAIKFTIGEQQDAQEFLLRFLECMEEEIVKYGNPELSDLFKNLFKFETRKRSICEKCKAVVVSETKEIYTIMMITIPTNVSDLSIPKLISKCFEEAPIKDGMPCQCGYKNWNQYQRMENQPDFLIVQLVRYNYVERGVKIKTPVRATKYLDLSDFSEPLVATKISALPNPSVISESMTVRSPLKGIENSNHLRQQNENMFLNKAPVAFKTCTPKSPLKINTYFKPISMKGGYGVNDTEFVDVPTKVDTRLAIENGSEIEVNLETNEILAITNKPHNIDYDILSHEEQLSIALAESLKDVPKNNLEDPEYEEAIRISRSEAEAKISCLDEVEGTLHPIIEEEEIEEEPLPYEIFGVINHIGPTLNGGHYISYVYDQASQVWHQYNDDKHQEKTMWKVKNESLNDGYLFFYSKR